MSAVSWSKDMVNSALRPLNVQVIHARSADPAVRSFISARRTVAEAEKAGLSVGDYVDLTYSEPGTTATTVEAMLKIADLGPDSTERVCEIGPGTGRYLEKVSAALRPKVYEVYETADDWLPYLRTLPGVQVLPSDGRTLASTDSASVDLVHAQKVFVYLEFWVTASYLAEMARVVRPGGVVAFDIVSEDCIDDQVLAEWIRSGSIFRPVPREWVTAFLGRQGLTYLGSHVTRLTEGNSELMVFRRTAPQA